MVRTYLKLVAFTVGSYTRHVSSIEGSESEQHFKVLEKKAVLVYEWSSLVDIGSGRHRRGKLLVPFISIKQMKVLETSGGTTTIILELKSPPKLHYGDQFYDKSKGRRGPCSWMPGTEEPALQQAVKVCRFHVLTIGHGNPRVRRELFALDSCRKDLASCCNLTIKSVLEMPNKSFLPRTPTLFERQRLNVLAVKQAQLAKKGLQGRGKNVLDASTSMEQPQGDSKPKEHTEDSVLQVTTNIDSKNRGKKRKQNENNVILKVSKNEHKVTAEETETLDSLKQKENVCPFVSPVRVSDASFDNCTPGGLGSLQFFKGLMSPYPNPKDVSRDMTGLKRLKEARTRESLQNLGVNELKEELLHRGLRKCGRKAELIDRIVMYDLRERAATPQMLKTPASLIGSILKSRPENMFLLTPVKGVDCELPEMPSSFSLRNQPSTNTGFTDVICHPENLSDSFSLVNELVDQPISKYFKVGHCSGDWVGGTQSPCREHFIALVPKASKLTIQLAEHPQLLSNEKKCKACGLHTEVYLLNADNPFHCWLRTEAHFNARNCVSPRMIWDCTFDPEGQDRMTICKDGHLVLIHRECKDQSLNQDELPPNCKTM
uniref:SAP domain-containing protein n=1 Tax=Mucochytrium quahogii TaxID=96639 RepID=A0A7S2RM77_9STRA|mmetsp:Transcript_17227/g.37639  ORF Transcript_17227/g.37639 Transcript_17227/m.37639 type:complete len:602 (+) Transcript_17227:479-2284(+)